MTVDSTTYVAADYRHLVSDLVLKVPYHSRAGSRRGRGLWMPTEYRQLQPELVERVDHGHLLGALHQPLQIRRAFDAVEQGLW